MGEERGRREWGGGKEDGRKTGMLEKLAPQRNIFDIWRHRLGATALAKSIF